MKKFKELSIKEGNHLIATKLFGYDYVSETENNETYGYWKHATYSKIAFDNSNFIAIKLEFHNNWFLLMECITLIMNNEKLSCISDCFVFLERDYSNTFIRNEMETFNAICNYINRCGDK